MHIYASFYKNIEDPMKKERQLQLLTCVTLNRDLNSFSHLPMLSRIPRMWKNWVSTIHTHNFYLHHKICNRNVQSKGDKFNCLWSVIGCTRLLLNGEALELFGMVVQKAENDDNYLLLFITYHKIYIELNKCSLNELHKLDAREAVFVLDIGIF